MIEIMTQWQCSSSGDSSSSKVRLRASISNEKQSATSRTALLHSMWLGAGLRRCFPVRGGSEGSGTAQLRGFQPYQSMTKGTTAFNLQARAIRTLGLMG